MRITFVKHKWKRFMRKTYWYQCIDNQELNWIANALTLSYLYQLTIIPLLKRTGHKLRIRYYNFIGRGRKLMPQHIKN